VDLVQRDLPEGVRGLGNAVGCPLGDSTTGALGRCGRVGTTFDLTLSSRSPHRPADESAEGLPRRPLWSRSPDRAAFSGSPPSSAGAGWDELGTVKRARLHRQIAERLDIRRRSWRPVARLADLAYHWSGVRVARRRRQASTPAGPAAQQAAEFGIVSLRNSVAGLLPAVWFIVLMRCLTALLCIYPGDWRVLSIARRGLPHKAKAGGQSPA